LTGGRLPGRPRAPEVPTSGRPAPGAARAAPASRRAGALRVMPA